jgi:hypothetical protein
VHVEEEKKTEYEGPLVLEAFKISDWSAVQLFTMRCRKIKHRNIHPYVKKLHFYDDITKIVDVDI